uniref:Uncharacterized protein n=1 Tax=Rhabditophanes sp. KR3021 TaxID=114890 RepID=A0AC35TUU6_9BILA
MLLYLLLPCFYYFAVLISSQADQKGLEQTLGTENEELGNILKAEPNTSCFSHKGFGHRNRPYRTLRPPCPTLRPLYPTLRPLWPTLRPLWPTLRPPCPTTKRPCPTTKRPCPTLPPTPCPTLPPTPSPTVPPIPPTPCPTKPPGPDICNRCENNCKINKICSPWQYAKYIDGHWYCVCGIPRPCDKLNEICSKQICGPGTKPTVCGDLCICKEC